MASSLVAAQIQRVSPTTHTALNPDATPPAVTPLPVSTLSYYDGGRGAVLKRVIRHRHRERPGGGLKRASATRFTRKMRSSVVRLTSSLRMDTPFYWVTLTYPTDHQRYPDYGYPSRSEDYTRHLRNLKDGLQRTYDGLAAIWRLQSQQERGAPHFHLAVYGTRADLPTFDARIRKLWAKQLGMPELPTACVHVVLAAGDHEQAPRLNYLAKLDRRQDLAPWIEHRGRLWGVWNRPLLPTAQRVEVSLYRESDHHRVKRSLLTHRARTSRRGRRRMPADPISIHNHHGGAIVAARLVEYYELVRPAHT